MPPPSSEASHSRLHVRHWAALLALSVLLVVVAEAIKLPAALMIGPMTAAIILATREAAIQIPHRVFIAAQGLIGFMIGRSIPITVLSDIGRDWPIFLLGVVLVIAAAAALGLLLARSQMFPGTTAIWGTSPGASTTMIIMSEAYGGDIRLVAVMQQLRIIGVAFIGTLVSKIWIGSTATSAVAVTWFPTLHVWPLLATIVLAAGTALVANMLRVAAGAILIPLVLAMLITETRVMTLELPPWLLAVSYAVIGWSIGLRFTRPILIHAFWALPKIIGSMLALMAVCGVIAAVLVVVAGVDPLTAYLATCPGGLDSVAIIAASSPVDMRFVMTMQTLRLVVALMVSPLIARWLSKRVQPLGPDSSNRST